MYDAAESYKSAVRSDCRCWRSRLDFGEFFVDTAESISLMRSSQAAEGVTVGAVAAPMIRITLAGLDHELTGRSFVWRLGVLPAESFTGDNLPEDFEYIPMGEFTVKSVRRNGLRYDLECAHKLAAADKTHISALTFPTTAQALMEEVVNSLGLTFRQTLSPELTVEALPEGAAKRDIMGWIAALYGGFVCADRGDGVSIRWYEDSGYTAPPSAFSSPDIGEQQVTYTAVTCAAGEQLYTYGHGRAMSFTCPFMTAERFEEIAPSLAGFTYRPCRLPYLLGDPMIDPWDKIAFSYDGESYSFPAAEISLEHKGGVTGALEAKDSDAESAERVDPITRAVNRLVQLIKDGRDEIEQDIADAVAEATAAIRGGAGGYFYIISDSDGTNKETIWCDNKDPDLATHGIRINTEGIGFWVKDPDDPESTLFNGPYIQAWTMDGKLIADFIKAGILSGIKIICTEGTIGGWTIREDAIVSPDESVRLESTYELPLTRHKDLRELTHRELRELTHREIRYMLSRTMGKARISAAKDADMIYMQDAAVTVEHSGQKQAVFDKSGMTLYDDTGKRFAGIQRSGSKLTLGGGALGGISWVVGLSEVFSFTTAAGFVMNGDLDARNIDAGDIDAADIAAWDVSSDMFRVTGRYESAGYIDPIEDHGGYNIYSPEGTFLGGARAAMIDGLEGIVFSPSWRDTEFFGIWTQHTSVLYDEDPCLAWYRESDDLRVSKTLRLKGDLVMSSGSSGEFKDMVTLSPYGLIFRSDGGTYARLTTSLVLPDTHNFDVRLEDADNFRLLDDTSVIWEYSGAYDSLHAYRDLDMHSHLLLNADIQSTSDERLKRDIRECEKDCLAVINALKLISFAWADGSGGESIGFSAQQAGEVSPDLQGSCSDRLTVREGRLIRYLVGAVQQLSREMEEIKCRLDLHE